MSEVKSKQTPQQILESLTSLECEVLIGITHEMSFQTAPRCGHSRRRQGRLARGLAAKGLLQEQYEKANGMWWFRRTPLGTQVRELAEKVVPLNVERKDAWLRQA